MKSYLWLFWLLAVTGLILDQTSKYGIFSQLYHGGAGGEIVVVENYFTIEAAYQFKIWEDDGSLLYRLRTISGEHRPKVNEGALFGLGHGHNWLFTVISIVAAFLIVLFSNRVNIRQDRFLCLALGLILAGTVGNCYDRLVFSGVRDFVHWFIGPQRNEHGQYVYDWPVFNIADCCLVVGASTLLIHAFFTPPEPAAAPATPTTTQESAVVPS